MEKPKVKWTGVALILLMVAVTFSGCVGQEEEGLETVTTTQFETVTTTEVKLETKLPEVIKIGIILPLTGTLGWLGPDMVRGAQIAEKEINRNGGIMGSPIELIIEDSETTPEGSVESATKLVDIDKVQAIIGAAGSANTLGVARGVTIDANVILISPASTSPEITPLDDDNTVWRTAGPDTFQGVAQAELADYMGWTTTAMMTVNNPYGIGLADAFEDSWGGDVVLRIEYDDTALAYQSELTSIKALDPDFFWLTCYATDGAEIMREMKELAIDIPVLSADGLGDLNVVVDNDVASRISNPPSIGTKPFAPTTPGGIHFQNLWMESHASEAAIAEWGLYPGAGVDDPVGIYAAESYDALNLLAMAISFAGEYTGDAIKEWLPYVSTIYKAAAGDKTFTPEGDVIPDYNVYMFTGDTMATAELKIIGSWNAITGLSMTEAPPHRP
ncbi:MAG: ABC transporter substrate-binding protein [Candidatus Heimdallarchaeota archaeon]